MTGVNREEGLFLVFRMSLWLNLIAMPPAHLIVNFSTNFWLSAAILEKGLFAELDQKWNEEYCPLLLMLEGAERKNMRVTCEAIRSKYFKELSINMNSLSDLIRVCNVPFIMPEDYNFPQNWLSFQVLSDRWFILSTLKSAQLHSRKAPTFLYKLEYEGEKGYMDVVLAEEFANGMPKPHGKLYSIGIQDIWKKLPGISA